MDEIYPILIGIFFGFLINTLWQTFKEKRKRKEKLNQIKEELESNFHEIHQKKNHIKKIISYLQQNKILPGYSVDFITTFYKSYLNELYPYLDGKERNSLHVIYQYFDVTDQMMNTFENDILNFLSLKIMNSPNEVYQVFAQRYAETITMLDKTQDLIAKHLEGNPVDVFYINRKVKPEGLK